VWAGTAIGAITFTGSLIAFGKLHGLLKSDALNLPGSFRHQHGAQHHDRQPLLTARARSGKNLLNVGMAAATLGSLAVFMTIPDTPVGLACLAVATGGSKHPQPGPR
jgi:NAD(P) transhydrogenase